LNLRTGKAGVFYDAGLNGESHHAIIPNVKTIGDLAEIAGRFKPDERRLFEVIGNLFMQAVAPDHVFEETKLALTIDGREFAARAVLTVAPGWRAFVPAADQPKAEDLVELSAKIADGGLAEVVGSSITSSTTKPPERFNEGSLVMAMKNAAKYIQDPELKKRLEDAKGIGTQATRDSIIEGLKDQGLIQVKGGKIYPAPAGEALFSELYRTAPDMIDPGKTAVWEHRLDQVLAGTLSSDAFVDEVAADVTRLLRIFATAKPSSAFGVPRPSDKMVKAVLAVQKATRSTPPPDFRTSFAACKAYLDAHPRQAKEA
jgi:DNA topoisomerase-3